MTKTQIMEKRGAESSDFHMAALTFLTGRGIKSRTHAHAGFTHFPTWCIIRTWKALGLWARASQAQMMHFIGKHLIYTQEMGFFPYSDLKTKF